MKPIRRNPLRFDIFNALTQFSQEERLSLSDPKTSEGFINKIRSTVDTTITNEAFLFGQRTQAMFEALVLSLGKVAMLKQEDAGEVHSTDAGIKIPDLRLVFPDGKQLLIEVKNFYQASDTLEPFQLQEGYIDGLSRYSKLLSCKLLIAVYWVRWNFWALVPASRFELNSGVAKLSYQSSMMFNEMAMLGDMMIACKFPLAIQIETRKDEPRTVESSGQVRFRASGIRILCAGQEVTTELERNIAWYLINYGSWEEQPSEAIVTADQLDAITCEWLPETYHESREEYDRQGFAMVGSLSGMFSKYFRALTLRDGRIGQLRIDISPGELGQMIPDDYKGQALPLWRFTMVPKQEEPPKTQ
jgi:hypothetical protein